MMDELITKQQAIDAIEKARAYIGHNMERAVGAAFIEILDDVEKSIIGLPPAKLATDTNVGTKLGTNLAQLGKDVPDINVGEFISRQAAIDLLKQMRKDGDMVPWEGKNVFARIRKMPSAQPDIIRCRNCKFASGDSRICMKFGHSPIGELDFCAWAERRTDEE